MESSEITPADRGWRLDHTYSKLPQVFHQPALPVAVKNPGLVIYNQALADSLGLAEGESAEVLSGNRLPEGAYPIAQAYAGHQFGHFTTLGDGRAILLGEQLTPTGERYDIQLKGPGRTAYSRGGDGRAAVGPMLREYIISEAMHALGIPSTRSLAVVTTGEIVPRQELLPGAILTRVAASHLRVGTFEWAAAMRDPSLVKSLADYTLSRHFSDCEDFENPYHALLVAVIGRQAELIAQWQCVGFIHGVMNTDNMAISGETIDYGPCAFMDAYDPATVFSSIDHRGRYAYQNQPRIAQWNLARFAETLLPLLDENQDQAVEIATGEIEAFEAHFQSAWLKRMRSKLGLFGEEEGDRELVKSLLEWMREAGVDFTNTFRDLSSPKTAEKVLVTQPEWRQEWHSRLGRQAESLSEVSAVMHSNNPAYIPRNHKVEEALTAASESGDYSVMHRLLRVIQRPYEDSPDHFEYSSPPAPGDRIYQTFCGT